MAQNMTAPNREEASTAQPQASENVYRPDVDILETDEEFILYADIPGVKTDHVDVRYEDGTLTLLGRVEPRQQEAARYLLNEYGIGDFFRTFQLSEVIDASRISAECGDGVLTLHLPKAEKAKPRKIAVQSG